MIYSTSSVVYAARQVVEIPGDCIVGPEERARWGDGPSSALRGAALGMLAGCEDRIYGYRLATMLARHLGPAWRIDAKNICRLLDSLEGEGLVDSELRRNTRGGVSKAYRVTDDAGRAIDEWMQAEIGGVPRRVELEARIAVSREHDIPALLRALDAYEHDCFQLLGKTGDMANPPLVSWRAVTFNISRKANSLHLQAELVWIEEARKLILDWRSRGPRPPRAAGPR